MPDWIGNALLVQVHIRLGVQHISGSCYLFLPGGEIRFVHGMCLEVLVRKTVAGIHCVAAVEGAWTICNQVKFERMPAIA